MTHQLLGTTEALKIITSSIRASAMPLAFRCPGSIRETTIRINTSNEAARLGSAAHKMAEALPVDGKVDLSIAGQVADEYDCDENELRFLCSRVEKAWLRIRESFPLASTEVGGEVSLEISGLVLTGTLDLLSVWVDTGRFLDYKFGRLDHQYLHQMMAYAAIVFAKYPKMIELTATIVWVRDLEIETYHITREQSDSWIRRVEREVIAWNGTYHPSEDCIYCQRFQAGECPAANALARSNVEAIGGLSIDAIENQLATMPGQQLIELKRKAKLVRQIAENAEEAIKQMVLKQGEIVGDDAKLVVINEPRRELNSILTYPIVEQLGFDENDWASVIKIGVSKLEDRVKTKAGRGNGAAAIRKLKDQLEQAGAVEIVDRLSVRERRL
jgi:hypothetical protein